MAGPSVAVKVLADLSGLGQAFDKAGGAAQSMASKAASAFHGMTGALNQTGVLGPFAGAIDGIGGAMDTLADKGKGLAGVMGGIGLGVAGVGTALSAMGSKDQASKQQLSAAIDATGKSYDDYSDQIEKSVSKQEKYGHTANQTMDALRVLTQAFGDPQKALDHLGEASDLAAAKHESLDTAASQLGKTYDGSTRLLKEFNLAQDKTKDSGGHLSKALDDLQGKLKGQASAAADTFSGKLDGIKAHLEDVVSRFGAKWGPAIQIFGVGLAALPALFGAASAAWEAMGSAEWFSLGPILLIVAAIGILIAIGWVIYHNWNTIWRDIKQWIGDAWQIVQDVWHWIDKNWPLLIEILAGPIGWAVALITKYWGDIKQGAADVWQWIKDGWNDIVDFFTKLPGRVAGVFATMWNGIGDAFKSVINAVIGAWNWLAKNLQISVHIKGSWWHPGIDFDSGQLLPNIKPLATGGIVTSPTLALLGEGGPEAVVPLGQRGLGPAVNIETAVFNEGADIDLLMSKVAFATAAGRL